MGVLDVDRKLLTGWRYPVPAPDIHDLREILQRPLEEDEKVPISQAAFDELLDAQDGNIHMNTIDPEILSTLFRVSHHKRARRITLRFTSAIQGHPPSTGTKDSFHWTYDANISNIIRLIIPGVEPGRNTNRGTSTALKRPDYTLSIKNNCIFRGEEKGSETDGDPRVELFEKIVDWLWDPLDYILGLS